MGKPVTDFAAYGLADPNARPVNRDNNDKAKADQFVTDVWAVLDAAGNLLIKKHHDYGPKNIALSPGGPLNGLRVRMWDKIARINNLLDSGVKPSNESLRDTTTGNSNVALGYGTLKLNTTGDYNIALGLSALFSNTVGNQNVALGYLALQSNTSGSSNIALGGNTLANNSTGNYNVALGASALYQNSVGGTNVAVGQSAFLDNISGSNNTGVGWNIGTGDFSGSLVLGAGATATANGQLALGSSTTPLGPVASEVSASSTHTLAINLNGNTYRLLMVQ